MEIRKLNLAQLRGRLVRSMAGTFGLRVANIGLSFVTSIVLARLVGAANYGTYVYAMTWVALLSVTSAVGLDKLMVRNMAAYQAKADWSRMRGLLRWASWIVLAVSFSLTLLVFLVVRHFYFGLDAGITRSILLIALLMLPIWTFTRLWQSAVRGLGWIVLGQLTDFLVRPLLFVCLLIVIYLSRRSALTVPIVMILQVVSSGVGVLLAAWFLRRALPEELTISAFEYDSSIWIASTLPLLLSNVLEIANIQADILLLGSLHGAGAVGIYNVSKRLAGLVAFVLIAVNMSIGPRMASLYATGNLIGLQRLVTKSVRIIFWGSLPFAVGLLLLGHWVLLLWGSEFVEGYTTLVILVVGQVVNAAMGPVALLLIMTRYERDAAWGVGIGLCINVGLNLLLIPQWGFVGTAVATLISTIAWNILLVVLAFRQVGIYAAVFRLKGLGK